MVDTYEAKFDYERERDDVLSFQKGEHFEIVNKTNDKWWVAKRISDGVVGYVPTVYLQTSNFRVIGKLVPEKRRNTVEHDIHLQALAELHRKIKPLPAHVIGAALGIPIPSSDEDSEDDLPTHQRKSVPTAVPTFLKVFNPAEAPLRKSFSGSVSSSSPSPSSPSPTVHSRSKSWRGETFTTTPSPSSTSQTFLRSPSPAEPKLPPGVSKKPPVAAPKKPPVSPLSTFEYKAPPKFSHKVTPVINNNNTSNGTTPYHHQCVASLSYDDDDVFDDLPLPPPPSTLPPPEPDYEQDEDDALDEIPYHHKLNSSGRVSSLSSEESNDLPSPTSPHGKSPLDLQHPNDEDRLIHPKPLVNPVLSSQNHQRLHRDLKMSIKTHGVGKVPIDSKPELAKRFQERKRQERNKEWDKEKQSKRSSMEVKLMERLKMEDIDTKAKEETLQGVREQPEFMRLRLKHTPAKT